MLRHPRSGPVTLEQVNGPLADQPPRTAHADEGPGKADEASWGVVTGTHGAMPSRCAVAKFA